MRKNFVLDTNVLLHDPTAIYSFEDNVVNIPIFVIEEIDRFKRDFTELGRNAREVSRILDEHRAQGSLREGVETSRGGTLRVWFEVHSEVHGAFLDSSTKDNLILSTALEIQSREPDSPCVFVTKDVNLRVRADAMGLKAENYETDIVPISELYPGACELEVPDELINALHADGELTLSTSEYAPLAPDLPEFNETGPMERFYENEYVLLKSQGSGNQSSLGRISIPHPDANEVVVQLLRRSREDVWGVRPRNKEQAFALDALLDDDIKLVTLVGKAGTGKTLLAIAAGLRQATDEEQYQKLIVSRPIVPLGKDVGYLPGSLEEKLNPWMRPIFDNVEYLMGLTKADKRAGRGADELIDMGLIEIEPLTYIRGRSLPDQYFIVDEAQNLTPHEVKTILTRVGENTKIILTGDPYQIDNPYVDSESNGLTYVVSRFRGQKLSATVTLFKGERSDLAELAADLL
jgi:PhoH-like ATPase